MKIKRKRKKKKKMNYKHEGPYLAKKFFFSKKNYNKI